jgi:DNA invertase Pin-like site-specific DNA recombinase
LNLSISGIPMFSALDLNQKMNFTEKLFKNNPRFIYEQISEAVSKALHMRKAVAYYRVSTDRQGKSKLGLEAQNTAVTSYIGNNDIYLVREFTEIESTRKDKRPILLQALNYCRRNKTMLIIAKLDRLARNVAFISTLMESKVEFVAVDNPNASKIVLHMLAAFAEHERDQISIRTREALQAAKRRGKKLGKHGMILGRENKRNADIFAMKMKPAIETLQANGFSSIRAITKELNRQKIPTFRKGKKWHSTTVYNLLARLRR